MDEEKKDEFNNCKVNETENKTDEHDMIVLPCFLSTKFGCVIFATSISHGHYYSGTLVVSGYVIQPQPLNYSHGFFSPAFHRVVDKEKIALYKIAMGANQ